MRIEIAEIKIDAQAHLRQVRDDAFWTFAAQQWHRLYQPYVPMQTGMLAQQVVITPGQIEHTVPYAHYIYTGHFRFRKDMHPLATREWDRAAEPTQKPKLIRAMQAYVDSGRLNLNG
jgi:hypothetical protein